RRTVPRRAWLTSLSVDGGRDENQTVRLNGITDSQSTVGETMLRLNTTKLYQAVDLHFTQAGKFGGHDTYEFEVAAHLPPVHKPKDEDNGTKVEGAATPACFSSLWRGSDDDADATKTG